MNQPSLFEEKVKSPSPSQQQVLEALRWLVVAADTLDIQRVLQDHDIRKDRNIISKRLGELEGMGLVERVGTAYDGRTARTTWRRVGPRLATK